MNLVLDADPGVSAWDLTRAISPRPSVRVAAQDAYGQVQNLYPSTTRVSGEVPSTTWAVYLTTAARAYRLLGFDLDAKGGDVEADLAALTGVLDDVGITHVVCASGSPGSRHVWVGLAEDVEENTVKDMARMVKALCPSLDMAPLSNPATGCLRPPGAPHRTGGRSQILSGQVTALTHPVVKATQIHELAARLVDLVGSSPNPAPLVAHTPGPIDAQSAVYIPGPKRPLPAASAMALNTLLPHQDASASLARVLTGAAAAHWHLTDIIAVVETAPGLEHVRTRRTRPGEPARTQRPATGPHSPTTVLREQWTKACAFVTRTQPQRPTEASDDTFDTRAGAIADLVERLQQRAAASPGRWAHGGGPADRRVLDALCVLALTAVTADLEADTRRLALMCGIGRETARTALLRLETDEWITRSQEATGPHGAHWKIAPQDGFHRDVDRTRSQGALRAAGTGATQRATQLASLTSRLRASTHDVFTPAGGLGHHVGNLYRLLSSTPVSTVDLAQELGDKMTRAAVLLDRLARHGLVLATPTGWRRPRRDHRTRAARLLGIEGRLTERAKRYKLERDLWAWWQAEEAWMRAARRPAAARRPGPGQLSLVEAGPPAYGAHPRRADGRADYRAARAILNKDPNQFVGATVPVDAETLLVELLGARRVA